MFQQQLKSTFLFLGILLIRFFVCVGIGYLWFIGVPFIFYMKAPHLETLEGYYIDERVDGDLLEFYSIAEEIETYGPDNKALAERVVIVARIGTVGFVWVFPALGFIWGLSQKKEHKKPKTIHGDFNGSPKMALDARSTHYPQYCRTRRL